MKVKSKNSDFRCLEAICRGQRPGRILGGGYFNKFTFFYGDSGQ